MVKYYFGALNLVLRPRTRLTVQTITRKSFDGIAGPDLKNIVVLELRFTKLCYHSIFDLFIDTTFSLVSLIEANNFGSNLYHFTVKTFIRTLKSIRKIKFCLKED